MTCKVKYLRPLVCFDTQHSSRQLDNRISKYGCPTKATLRITSILIIKLIEPIKVSFRILSPRPIRIHPIHRHIHGPHLTFLTSTPTVTPSCSNGTYRLVDEQGDRSRATQPTCARLALALSGLSNIRPQIRVIREHKGEAEPPPR